MITVQALIDKFRQALSENWGYIWGTAGEKWTAAKQKELEKTKDSDRAQGREYGSKWIGHTVADCSGLFSWAFKQLGGYMYHGSDTMYRKYCVNKGELRKGKRTDCGTLKPGTAVFVWNGKKYSHVGLFVGDGTVIEAMGTINGVTTTRVTAGKWTHWGELVGIDYVNTGKEASSNVISTGAAGGVEKSPPPQRIIMNYARSLSHAGPLPRCRQCSLPAGRKASPAPVPPALRSLRKGSLPAGTRRPPLHWRR